MVNNSIPASVHTLLREFRELIFEATIGFLFTGQSILQQSIRLLSILRFGFLLLLIIVEVSSTVILFLVTAAITSVVTLAISFPIVASPSITGKRNSVFNSLSSTREVHSIAKRMSC